MLPVAEIFPQLLSLLHKHNIVLLSAPPGAGKSTYLPLQLLQHIDFQNKNIIMLEPRRLAAKSIAAYLATQLGQQVGQTVGYQIRHEQKISANTRLLIVTEGVLTRKIQQDPELKDVDLLLFDEFHERSLHADLALALCLDVQQLRPDLTLLIMSATLDMQQLGARLDAPIVKSDGRSFDVDIKYIAADTSNIAIQSARLAWQALSQHSGNILVFLPGQAEITQAANWLQQQGLPDNVQLHALLGSMTLVQQQAAIAAPLAGQRKVVLATNLAETSLTIEGITVVVDSGLCRRARFNPRQGITTLETVNISQASAIQRAGRAGRLSAGTCYRIDTAEKWQRRLAFEPAEIDIAELTSLRLEVAVWGAQINDLNWISPPPTAHVLAAEQLLQQLGLLDSRAQLTALGRAAHQLGTEPRLAAMLLHATALEKTVPGALWLSCLLAALMEDSRLLQQDIYQQLQQFKRQLPQQWQQALKFGRQLSCQVTDTLPLQLVPVLLLRAFPDRLAKRRGQGYQLASGAGAVLTAGHALSQQPWLVVLHLQQNVAQNRIYHALAIDLDDILTDWQPQLQWQTVTGWDNKAGQFYSEQQLNFGQCRLLTKPVPLSLTAEQKQQAWLGFIAEQGLSCLPWSDNSRHLLARQALIAHYLPNVDWPETSELALLAELANWLGPYLTSVTKSTQLMQLPIYEALWQRLNYSQQQQLTQWLPTHWQAPTGSKLPIDYLAEGGPRLSVRIQEMYGQMASPTLMQGQLKLTIELLSPGRQPLQLTQDLASFWHNAWVEVRKEMRGRYPKHYWPDDPAQAMPTTKTKKAMLR